MRPFGIPSFTEPIFSFSVYNFRYLWWFLVFFVISYCQQLVTASDQEQTHMLAVPWVDHNPGNIHLPATCSFTIRPLQTEDLAAKGTFVHFTMGKKSYIARASLYNGRFCTVDVYRMEHVERRMKFKLMASSRLPYQVLDLKAAACDETEAYIVVLLTKDGESAEAQLLVFKPDEKAREKFVIAHNGQLSTCRGVADVSIYCFQKHVVFAVASSTTLLPAGVKEARSSVRVWSSITRTVVRVLPVETTNAVTVVAFESGRCLMHVFAQNSNGGEGGPLDSLVFCLSADNKAAWKLEFIQSINLCEVYGLELYMNGQNELGLIAAVSPKVDEYEQCPKSSLSMKWGGKQFVHYDNISMKGVSDFFYLPSPCCSLLAAKQTSVEKSLMIVGSTEPLFEGVQKMQFISVAERSFFLISFSGDIHQAALHELVCDNPFAKKAESIKELPPTMELLQQPPHAPLLNGSARNPPVPAFEFTPTNRSYISPAVIHREPLRFNQSALVVVDNRVQHLERPVRNLSSLGVPLPNGRQMNRQHLDRRPQNYSATFPVRKYQNLTIPNVLNGLIAIPPRSSGPPFQQMKMAGMPNRLPNNLAFDQRRVQNLTRPYSRQPAVQYFDRPLYNHPNVETPRPNGYPRTNITLVPNIRGELVPVSHGMQINTLRGPDELPRPQIAQNFAYPRMNMSSSRERLRVEPERSDWSPANRSFEFRHLSRTRPSRILHPFTRNMTFESQQLSRMEPARFGFNQPVDRFMSPPMPAIMPDRQPNIHPFPYERPMYNFTVRRPNQLISGPPRMEFQRPFYVPQSVPVIYAPQTQAGVLQHQQERFKKLKHSFEDFY